MIAGPSGGHVIVTTQEGALMGTDSPVPRTTANLAATIRELLGERPQRELADLLGLDASAARREPLLPGRIAG